MKKYLKALNTMNDLIISNAITDKELDQVAGSDIFWARTKLNAKSDQRKIKQGDVFQFEFGKNPVPEMSYEHRGLVVGVKKQLLYVMPIFTYRPDQHEKELYDPKDNPLGNLFMLPASDYSFIKHDSVLKLNDLRTVSVKRILFKQESGHIDINSEAYKNIIWLAFEKYFPSFAKELQILRAENQSLQKIANTEIAK